MSNTNKKRRARSQWTIAELRRMDPEKLGQLAVWLCCVAWRPRPWLSALDPGEFVPALFRYLEKLIQTEADNRIFKLAYFANRLNWMAADALKRARRCEVTLTFDVVAPLTANNPMVACECVDNPNPEELKQLLFAKYPRAKADEVLPHFLHSERWRRAIARAAMRRRMPSLANIRARLRHLGSVRAATIEDDGGLTALGSLNQDEFLLVVLRGEMDMTFPEIAGLLGQQTDAVKKRFQRMQQRLSQ
jgi:hypothetical protein